MFGSRRPSRKPSTSKRPRGAGSSSPKRRSSRQQAFLLTGLPGCLGPRTRHNCSKAATGTLSCGPADRDSAAEALETGSSLNAASGADHMAPRAGHHQMVQSAIHTHIASFVSTHTLPPTERLLETAMPPAFPTDAGWSRCVSLAWPPPGIAR